MSLRAPAYTLSMRKPEKHFGPGARVSHSHGRESQSGKGLFSSERRTGRVEALEEKTGKTVWSQQIGEVPAQKGESVTGAPTYAEGIVFAGLANGDWALRGRVVALEAKTGRELWHFFTVPGPREMGHESWDHGMVFGRLAVAECGRRAAIDPRIRVSFTS